MIWYYGQDPVQKNQECAVPLGIQGENQSLVYTADVSDWLALWPNGVVALVLQAPDKSEPYMGNTSLDRENGVVTWTITNFDTSIVGYGFGELRIVENDVVKKSYRFATYIRPSILASAAEPPAPIPDWINDLLEAADNIQEAVDAAEAAQAGSEAAQAAAETAAASAIASKADVDTLYNQTVTAKDAAVAAQTDARQSMDVAAQAKADAVLAKKAAVDAQDAAELAARNASMYKDSAYNAKNSAQAAQTAAETAQGKAETAQAAAETAQTGAETALASTLAAKDTAISAITAQQATSVAAVTAEGTTQKNAVQAKGQEVIASIPQDYTALSTEVDDLKSAVGDLVEPQNPINLLHGTITSGYIIDANGTVSERSEYSYSDYIEIDPSKTYIAFTRQATSTTRTIDGMTTAFYDKDKTFISRLSGNVKTIPTNAKYIRQNIITTYVSSTYKPMVEYTDANGTIAGEYSDWFAPYNALISNYGATFNEKKICVFGDSLAANGNGGSNAWINILANMLQFKAAYNRGIGGSRITNTETRYAYIDAEGDAYNRSSYATQQTAPTGYTEINPCMSLPDRINTIPTDTDVLIVLAGANDASGVTLDAIRDAYATMLDGIYARVPNARVLLGTLLYNNNWDNNENEQIIAKYNGIRSIVKDMGALYGYPVIDFKGTMGVNKQNYTEYMDSDGVHYTSKIKGKNRIAEVAIPGVYDIKYIT